MDKYLSVLKALTDETRLRIINLLYERELCVCEIEEIVGEPQTKISRHLAYLRNSGLISGRRSAQWTYYSMDKSIELKFVNELVYGLLRKMKIYKDDLIVLKKKTKTGKCGMVSGKKEKKDV